MKTGRRELKCGTSSFQQVMLAAAGIGSYIVVVNAWLIPVKKCRRLAGSILLKLVKAKWRERKHDL